MYDDYMKNKAPPAEGEAGPDGATKAGEDGKEESEEAQQ